MRFINSLSVLGTTRFLYPTLINASTLDLKVHVWAAPTSLSC